MTKIKTLAIILTSFFIFSCSSEEPDPCEMDPNALECLTGDFDNDGVLNGEDTAPEDPCVPNKPSFEDNVIGTWDWSVWGQKGQVKINADGTYEDLENELISNGVVNSRTWYIEDGILNFDVENARVFFEFLEYDCNRIDFNNQGVSEIFFTRV